MCSSMATFGMSVLVGFGVGAFDLTLDDGRLTYHVAHAFGERGLDDDAVGRLVATALQTADRYFPALTLVMFGGHTASDAIFLADLDCSADAVEDPKPAKPSRTPPNATTPPAKQKARRPRRDPRLKGTRELPGLFDPKAKKDPKAADSDSTQS